jgi:alkylhydroperoxidase/carboxymuconolactone decarboxylase family protein YurZ
VYFHTKAARLHGATDAEINEAIAQAALGRHWSAFLNGAQINETLFRTDIDKIVRKMREKSKTSARK